MQNSSPQSPPPALPANSLEARLLRLEQLEVLRAAVYQIEFTMRQGGGLVLGPDSLTELEASLHQAQEKIGVILRQIMKEVAGGVAAEFAQPALCPGEVEVVATPALDSILSSMSSGPAGPS